MLALELSLGLLEGRQVGPRIDQEEKVALVDKAPLLVASRLEVSGHAGPDLGGDRAFERPHPLSGDGHVLLENVRHDDVDGCGLTRRFPLA